MVSQGGVRWYQVMYGFVMQIRLGGVLLCNVVFGYVMQIWRGTVCWVMFW